MKYFNDLNNRESFTSRYRAIFIIGVCALLIVAASAIFSGCSSDTINDLNKANNTVYLAQVNAVSKSVNAELSNFSQFAKDKDVDAMQNSYTLVQDNIDTLTNTAVPENMNEAHNSYVSAFTQLQASLKDYIQVYSDMKSGAQTSDVLAKRISTVQSEYDQGINMMNEAEKKASEATAA